MSDKHADLKKVLADINKTLNLNISRIKDVEPLDVEVVPSGSFSLDDALGVGGYPKGRITEIFGKQAGGKTMLSLLAIAEAQKMGGLAAFIDVEHAFDPTWAKKLGVDVDNLYFVQPSYGEQALTAVEELVKTNKFDIIVIDSTAALIPKAELEAELEDQQIAQQARMMSRALRVLTEPVGKSKTAVIFINQVRTNPMQMFGDCFEASSKVVTNQGLKTIGTIVNQELPVKVLSYNFKKKQYEFVDVQNYLKKSLRTDFLSITTAYPHDSGLRGFRCTLDHKIWTSQGWKKANTLQKNDKVAVDVPMIDEKSQVFEILTGSLLGDGSVTKNQLYTGQFEEEHCVKQREYVNWKKQFFGEMLSYQYDKKTVGFQTTGFVQLGKLRDKWYPQGKKIVPEDINLTPLSIAVWYMDDGHLEVFPEKYGTYKSYNMIFSTLAFSKEENQRLLQQIEQKFDIQGRLQKFPAGKGYQIVFNYTNTRKLATLIRKFVIPSMQYKLPSAYREMYNFKIQEPIISKGMAFVDVLSVKPYHRSKRSTQFDLQTKNHNFVVDDILVHNSETTPGGDALKFYCSVRLRVVKEGGTDIKEGSKIVGHKVKISVRKNKVAAPFGEASFIVRYATGIDRIDELATLAVDRDIVQLRGPMYSFQELKWMGKEKFVEALRADEVLQKKVWEAIKGGKKI